MIESQKYTPSEMGLGRLVSPTKGRFIGQQALRAEHSRGHARQVVGLDVHWTGVEQIYEKLGLPPTVAATASRVAVPVYRNGRQVGRATTTTWSPGTEEDDRARDGRSSAFQRGYRAGDRDDRGSRAAPGQRDGRGDAVLRSSAEDGDTAALGTTFTPTADGLGTMATMSTMDNTFVHRAHRAHRVHRELGRRPVSPRVAALGVELHNHLVERVEQILAIRVGPRGVGARRDARL